MATRQTDQASVLKQWLLRRVRNTAIGLGIALLLVVGIRATAAQTFTAPAGFMLPEIPAGAHVLVWKIGSDFQPGHVIVYRDVNQRAMFGRVVDTDAASVTVTRDNEPQIAVSRADIVGRVVLNTR